jgi:hypothetical protein
MANAYGGGPAAQERARVELRENRYDPKTDVLLVNEAQLQAFKTDRQSHCAFQTWLP